MAYLQRTVNGGGYIDREYGVGRGRIDLLVRWPYSDRAARPHCASLRDNALDDWPGELDEPANRLPRQRALASRPGAASGNAAEPSISPQ